MFRVLTDHPVAHWSVDHQDPGGTANDNSRNRDFNRKLYRLFPGATRPLRITDWGCSGGGFVRDCLDDGHHAFGLEGSDYSLVRRRAEWGTIPQSLACCDITEPFRILRLLYDNGPDEETVWDNAAFDVITLWEVIEHLPEPRLPQFSTNLANHLAPGGMVIGSISTVEGGHHPTVQPREWWMDFWASQGWANDDGLVQYFGDDWVRGPQQGAPGSFHVCLRRPLS